MASKALPARTSIVIPSIIICMVMFLFNTSSILNIYAQHSGAATSGSAVGQGATSGAATSGSATGPGATSGAATSGNAVGQGATSGAATSGNATSGNANLTSNSTSVSQKPSSPF
jgi:hypothetical protein